MKIQDRFNYFIHYFQVHQPDVHIELDYTTPWELTLAVLLSAQCTDKRVNLVTPRLFMHFPTPQHLAGKSLEEVLPYIQSISYPNNKTKYIIQLADKLVKKFQGQLPQDVDTLQTLPGIGRKSAHVLASVLYGEPAMPVDTHVFRVARRIGLAPERAKTPLAVEKALVKHIPPKTIPMAHHWLVLHGRYICVARKPKCEKCPLTMICRYFQGTSGYCKMVKGCQAPHIGKV